MGAGRPCDRALRAQCGWHRDRCLCNLPRARHGVRGLNLEPTSEIGHNGGGGLAGGGPYESDSVGAQGSAGW